MADECLVNFHTAMENFRRMFPDVNSVEIERVLRKHDGDVSQTVDELLTMTTCVEDVKRRHHSARSHDLSSVQDSLPGTSAHFSSARRERNYADSFQCGGEADCSLFSAGNDEFWRDVGFGDHDKKYIPDGPVVGLEGNQKFNLINKIKSKVSFRKSRDLYGDSGPAVDFDSGTDPFARKHPKSMISALAKKILPEGKVRMKPVED